MRGEKMKVEEENKIEITLDLHQASSQIPDGLTNGDEHRSTIELIHRTLPQRYINRLNGTLIGFNGAILHILAFLYFIHI